MILKEQIAQQVPAYTPPPKELHTSPYRPKNLSKVHLSEADEITVDSEANSFTHRHKITKPLRLRNK